VRHLLIAGTLCSVLFAGACAGKSGAVPGGATAAASVQVSHSSASGTSERSNRLASGGSAAMPSGASDQIVQTAVAPELSVIDFVGNSDGWIAGNGVLFRTTDGGNHWIEYSTGHGVFHYLSFLNAQDGWALTTHHVLLTSTSGETWSLAVAPANGPVVSLDAVSPTEAFGIVSTVQRSRYLGPLGAGVTCTDATGW